MCLTHLQTIFIYSFLNVRNGEHYTCLNMEFGMFIIYLRFFQSSDPMPFNAGSRDDSARPSTGIVVCCLAKSSGGWSNCWVAAAVGVGERAFSMVER